MERRGLLKIYNKRTKPLAPHILRLERAKSLKNKDEPYLLMSNLRDIDLVSNAQLRKIQVEEETQER